MNLENLNLVELNAQEVKEVDGGTTVGPIYNPFYHASTIFGLALTGANTALTILGGAAGIGDGIRNGMN